MNEWRLTRQLRMLNLVLVRVLFMGYQCLKKIFLSVLIFCLSVQANARIAVTDYLDRRVELEKPAQRVVALAPHIVENLYAAGAGNTLVGAVDYCDYPPEAKEIPRVGAISAYSLEAIVALKPDLVLIWGSGHGAKVLPRLVALGLPVYASDPRTLEDIPRSIRDIGKLTGNSPRAEQSAVRFETRHAQLQKKYGGRQPVSVLYQVWNQPLQTLNDAHVISDVIRLCGGRNIFGDAPTLAPRISLEAVLTRDPDVIIASGMGEARPEWLDDWKKWPSLSAVKHNHLYFVPPDIIQRHTPRILQGTQLLCEHVAKARSRVQ